MASIAVLATAGRVWAMVTANPHASVRELAAERNIAYTTAAAALRELHAAGYVVNEGARARRVVVPLGLLRPG